MRQFFKYVFATIVGLGVFIFIGFLLLIGIAASLGSKSDKTITVKANSVLQIDFPTPIAERSSDNPFAGFDFINSKPEKTLGLYDIVQAIHHAKTDGNIKGIFLDLTNFAAYPASSQEIRDALVDFKKSGKFIYSYAEYYSQGMYGIAAVADKVMLNKKGMILFNGLVNEQMFYKGLFDKIGVDVYLIRPSDNLYKSFGEPFTRTGMSDANRQQISSYLNSLYAQYLSNISQTRGIDTATLHALANNLSIKLPQDAVTHKLVDELVYRDEVMALIMEKVGVKKEKDINFVDFGKYVKLAKTKTSKYNKTRIGIVYANGDIGPGEGDDETIGSDRIAEAIKSATDDEGIKAIVLRVNSPGGSALASDVIWRAMELAKAKKPIVVSIGGVAASGGYYIAAPANKIIAQPNSITGSIGVFSIFPNTQNMFEDKLGITFDRVKTATYADLGNTNRAITEADKGFFQNMVDQIYTDFVGVVAAGRGKTTDYVRTIAQGRVYTGTQALDIGLVDELGSFEYAVEQAAKLAKISDYSIKEFPKMIDPVEELMKSLTGQSKMKAFAVELGPEYSQILKAKKMLESNYKVQTRLEYDINIK